MVLQTFFCLSIVDLPYCVDFCCESESDSHSVVFDSCATPRTVAHQAPPSMGFSRQEYQSGLPFPFAVDLPDSGIEPRSPELQAESLLSGPPGKPKIFYENENH